jgi:3-deoxy-manno-octulosonate cytidylyltransferase (CMP-KDO synthetase)
MARPRGDDFVALIPARRASTRLPDKPLADLEGLPMVVRVAQQARQSGAQRVAVATEDEQIAAVVRSHGFEAVITAAAHVSGTDRLAEAARILDLDPATIVVNVQGDEPLMPPQVIADVARLLQGRADCEMATVAHPLQDTATFFDPNVVKVVLDHAHRALLFSRAPVPWPRDAFAAPLFAPVAAPIADLPALPALPALPEALPDGLPALRHVGLYAYRAGFLQRFPQLTHPAIERHESLEQLRALWHGARIAVLVLAQPLPPGVDTPADLARVREWLRQPPATAARSRSTAH